MSKFSHFTSFTHDELSQIYADFQHPAVQKLVGRLQKQEPYSVFVEQAAFMRAADQTIKGHNYEQAEMYWALIEEEMEELRNAEAAVDEFDAVLDLIVVLIGFGISCGYPMQAGWDEVMRSNFAKVDPATGKVRRRADGKILKPDGWTPPKLGPLLEGL